MIINVILYKFLWVFFNAGPSKVALVYG